MAKIRFKRGTRAQLDSAAGANGLAEGEPYLVTDEGRMAFGLSASTYMFLENTMRTWASGMTVRQWEVVVSPTDGEEYRRTASTGGGTTDPADDTTNYVADSYTRVTALPGGITPYSQAAASGANFANGAVKVATGVIAAGARTQILSVSGRGLICYLGFMKGAANGGRLEVAIDGRSVFDASIQSANSDANVLIGSAGPGGSSFGYAAYYALPEPGIEVKRSLVVHYTPTTTATHASNTVLAHIIREQR